MAKERDVRPAAVSGLFYPSDAEMLGRELDAMLSAAGSGGAPRRVAALISPHAGIIYSGPTAAYGYALLRGSRYGTVVVVAPSHREAFEGVSVYPGKGYATPLGVVPVDGRLRDRLLDRGPTVTASLTGHRSEHAIEVQLPFLQRTIGTFSLLPLVMGSQSAETCYNLGEALAEVLRGEDFLLVASTDLSHYYPASVACRLDAVGIEDIKRFDYRQFVEDLEGGRTEACGGGPVAAVMAALDRLGARTIEILNHSTSGDITGDRKSVVGYLSAAAYV